MNDDEIKDGLFKMIDNKPTTRHEVASTFPKSESFDNNYVLKMIDELIAEKHVGIKDVKYLFLTASGLEIKRNGGYLSDLTLRRESRLKDTKRQTITHNLNIANSIPNVFLILMTISSISIGFYENNKSRELSSLLTKKNVENKILKQEVRALKKLVH